VNARLSWSEESCYEANVRRDVQMRSLISVPIDSCRMPLRSWMEVLVNNCCKRSTNKILDRNFEAIALRHVKSNRGR
jgi:hypothetical protein